MDRGCSEYAARGLGAAIANCARDVEQSKSIREHLQRRSAWNRYTMQSSGVMAPKPRFNFAARRSGVTARFRPG